MDSVLVTGWAGFIGYHLSQSLIKDGINVLGVDNLNEYYGINLKNNRLLNLKANKNSHWECKYSDISVILQSMWNVYSKQ